MFEVEIIYSIEALPRLNPTMFNDVGEYMSMEFEKTLAMAYYYSKHTASELRVWKAEQLSKHPAIEAIEINWMPPDWLWRLANWCTAHNFSANWLHWLIEKLSP